AAGPVLCERTITPTLDSCRALLESGVTGQFETWHEGDSFARLTGDIANVAKLEVKEGPVRFVRYEPVATADVPQSRPDSPSVSDGLAWPWQRTGARARPRPIWPPCGRGLLVGTEGGHPPSSSAVMERCERPRGYRYLDGPLFRPRFDRGKVSVPRR